jgi:DNA polymerase-3 subunit delta'
VHFINKGYSQEIKIEDIRGLRQEASLRPYEARYKVFIINDAHNLNDESSNAFLKTLEEPPGHSIIILISDKPALLFRTVISRCRKIKFSALRTEDLEGILRDDYSIDKGLLYYIARFSEGRLGCALRMKDRDILTEKNRIIDYFTSSPHPSIGENIVKDREQLRYDLQVLASWFRDIYLLKAEGKNARLINQDRMSAIRSLADFYTFGALDEIIRTVSDSLFFIERNVNVKLLISQLCLSFQPAH